MFLYGDVSLRERAYGKERGMTELLYLSCACPVERRETVFHIRQYDSEHPHGQLSGSRLQRSSRTAGFGAFSVKLREGTPRAQSSYWCHRRRRKESYSRLQHGKGDARPAYSGNRAVSLTRATDRARGRANVRFGLRAQSVDANTSIKSRSARVSKPKVSLDLKSRHRALKS